MCLWLPTKEIELNKNIKLEVLTFIYLEKEISNIILFDTVIETETSWSTFFFTTAWPMGNQIESKKSSVKQN